MKVPLSFTLKNRDSTTAKDARVLNGYVEVIRNRRDQRKVESVRTIKRPAMDSAFELTAGPGQGLFVPTFPDGDGPPQVIINDILTRAPTAKTKALRFGVQPSQSTLNTAISPSVTVTIRDSVGGIVNSIANVTLALSSNPTGATLGGTLTRAAVAGTATFNDLTLNRSGDDFTLRATSSGLNSAVSSAFDIPTACVFTVQPADTVSGTLDPVEVTIQDTAGNTDTAYNGNITLSIYSSTGAGTLSGTLTVQAVAGIASFTNLQIDLAGTYTLLAIAEEVSTAYPPTRVVSDSFSIGYIMVSGSVVIGPPVGTLYGFSASAGLGSMTPGTLNGQTINALAVASLTNVMTLSVAGSLSQNFFNTISLLGFTLNSSDASYQIGGGPTTLWSWTFSPLVGVTGTVPISFT